MRTETMKTEDESEQRLMRGVHGNAAEMQGGKRMDGVGGEGMCYGYGEEDGIDGGRGWC